MNKYPFTESFMLSTLSKAFSPFKAATPFVPILARHQHQHPQQPQRRQHYTSAAATNYHPSRHHHQQSLSCFWATIAIVCLSVLSSSSSPSSPFITFADAAPAKHAMAPNKLVKAMGFQTSETSPLPLQLQLEAAVAGTQKLAYLPTTGPALDFYYLNYRPSYLADGKSKIDFWMLSAQDATQPTIPKTGSLELFDEFGKIHLATLVPPGTEIPQDLAKKNEPFLWKSWTIPKELKADFDFSEKFRVVLKTSENNNKKKEKRAGEAEESSSSRVVVRDRQFRIKDLKATPGGQPNPAKLRVNHVASSSSAPVAVPAVPKSSANPAPIAVPAVPMSSSNPAPVAVPVVPKSSANPAPPRANAHLDTKAPGMKSEGTTSSSTVPPPLGSLNNHAAKPSMATMGDFRRISAPLMTLLAVFLAMVVTFC